MPPRPNALASAFLDLLGSTERSATVELALKDYNAFTRLLEIVPKGKARQRFELNEIQRERVRRRTPRDTVLKPRQVGMTTEEQARDLFKFLQPGARVVIMCQSSTDQAPLKQLSGTYAVMFDSLRKAGLKLNFGTEAAAEWTLPDRDSTLRIIQAGASEAAAQKKGRAGTITRLHCTETAFWEYADATLLAILECVPDPELGSEIVFESTPNGASGRFFSMCNEAREGRSGYQFLFFPWFAMRQYAVALEPGEYIAARDEREHGLVKLGCSPEQLKWRRRKIAEKGGGSKAEDEFDQEYPSDPDTCFLVSGRIFFDKATVQRLLARCLPEASTGEHGRLRVWHKPDRAKQYVIGVDTSEGLGEEEPTPDGDYGPDAAAAVVRERGSGRHMATLWGQYKTHDLAEACDRLGQMYNVADIAVERNNHGHAVLQWLTQKLKYPRVWHDADKRPGWVNSHPKRVAALDAVEHAVRMGHWDTRDRAHVTEMLRFVVKDGKPQGAHGSHDDLVLADAICWDVLSKVKEAPRGMGQRSVGIL